MRAMSLQPELRATPATWLRWLSVENKDLPSLQWDVTVQHPAVLELNRLWGGGQVVGSRSWGVDLTPPIGQWVPVEGVGRGVVVGQGVVMRGRQRGPQCWLAVVVWRTWKRGRRNSHQYLSILASGTLHLWGRLCSQSLHIYSDWKPQTRDNSWDCIECPSVISHKQMLYFSFYLSICIN